MTCIAGFTKGDTTYIGADSAVSWGTSLAIRTGCKLFVKGEYLIGCAGSVRFEQSIQHAFEPPDISPHLQPDDTAEDWYHFMVREFAAELRAHLDKHRLLVPDKEAGQRADGNMLVGLRGQLFEVDYGFTVCQWDDRIHAIGSGGELARGALMVTDVAPGVAWRAAVHTKAMAKSSPLRADHYAGFDNEMLPDLRMFLALDVAGRGSTGVCPPYQLGTSTRKGARIIAL